MPKIKKQIRRKAGTVPASRAATDSPDSSQPRWLAAAVCLLLAGMVLFVFGRTRQYDFTNYDDEMNVVENAMVRSGVTAAGITWAFTHPQIGHWDPITTLSHMTVCQFFGLNPGAHHLTNVVLHAISAMLLFLVLRRMTRATWRSAFVAALFAIHPLHVESVAWVSERKDMLSGLFFMLTLGAYARYAARPASTTNYLLVVALFGLGLMCKSMLVTLPFVLLLLDYWPLRRFVPPSRLADATPTEGAPFVPATNRRLILEKIPLLILSAAAAVAQLLFAKEMIAHVESLPMTIRAGNALASYAAYIGQLFVPVNMAVLYPHPWKALPLWQPAMAFLLLAAISAAVIAGRKRHPYGITGWLWFLGMLVPVIGLVQSGTLSRADRYTYLPHIGLYVLLAWAGTDYATRWRVPRAMLASLAMLMLAGLAGVAARQTSFWRDSETLWAHALDCTEANAEAHNNLGHILCERGRVEEAVPHFEKAMEIDPESEEAYNNLGCARLDEGRVDEAMLHFRHALQLSPLSSQAHANLGNALMEKNLVGDAVVQYRKALELKPDSAGTEYGLGNGLLGQGHVDEAVAHFLRALELQPNLTPAQANLAWIMATSPEDSLRHGQRAVELAQRASQSSGNSDPMILRILAAAYAEAGRYSDAVETAQRASQIAESQANPMLAARLRAQVELYQAGTPLRVPALERTPAPHP